MCGEEVYHQDHARRESFCFLEGDQYWSPRKKKGKKDERGGKQKPAENRVVGDIACSEERNLCFHFFSSCWLEWVYRIAEEATHHIFHSLIHVEDILYLMTNY